MLSVLFAAYSNVELGPDTNVFLNILCTRKSVPKFLLHFRSSSMPKHRGYSRILDNNEGPSGPHHISPLYIL